MSIKYEVINVAEDRRYEHLRRVAPNLVEEPFIKGERLKLRSRILITADEYRMSKDYLAQHVKAGVLVVNEIKPQIVAVVEAPPPPVAIPDEPLPAAPPPPPPPAPAPDPVMLAPAKKIKRQ